MLRMNPKKLKELEKYTKAEIIEAIGRNFNAGYIVDDLLNDLKNRKTQQLLDDEREADRLGTEKLKALLAWRNEMCQKYGNGSNVRLSDIPPEEIQRGAKFEREYEAAVEAVDKLEKRIKKAMEEKKENDDQ